MEVFTLSFLDRRINRKTFALLIFLAFVIFTPLFQKVQTWDVQPRFFAYLCWILMCFVFVKWRANDIGLSNVKTILWYIVLCIPLVGIIPVIYLVTKKGTPVEMRETRTEDLAEQMARQEQQQFFELVERYRRYLKKEDLSHDAAIAQDLFAFCQGVPRLDKVVRQCHAQVGKFQDAYASLKRENILWAGGEYLPFLAFRDDKALRILLNDPALEKEESLTNLKRILKQKVH